MDGWTDGRTDGCRDGWMDECINKTFSMRYSFLSRYTVKHGGTVKPQARPVCFQRVVQDKDPGGDSGPGPLLLGGK